MTFAEFVARKTAEASTARLLPYTTELEHPAPESFALGNDWTRAIFDGPFYVSPARQARRPSVNLVFVQSADGNTGASDPAALGGGETDKHLVYEGLSRVAADAVMAGAETIRGGETVFSVWHPELVHLRAHLNQPRHPIQIIATLRGLNLAQGIMFNTPEIRVFLITVESCLHVMDNSLQQRPWIETIVMERAGDLPRAFADLRARGVERVSCIGGRTVAAQLIDAGLVDDLYLTTSPRAGGQPGTPMYPRPLPRSKPVLKKRGTGAEEGVTFEHRSFH
jgi:5-amino-6-(5-phosphoribosylamino)uracil reductase